MGDDQLDDLELITRASPGQNSEAAHPANRKRRLLGTRHGQLSVLSCLTFGSCRIGLPLAAPSGTMPVGISSCISCARRLSQLARVTWCESTLTIAISSNEKLFSMLFRRLLCIWLHSLRPTNGGRRRVVGVPCFVQGSKWPPTSGIILCQ